MAKTLTLPIYDLSGQTIGQTDLDPTVFAQPLNQTLVHQAIVAILANRRHPIADTKDRREVAGSGKKPWRQKGTGRARHGSVRSPIWRGGGITFGPTAERNFSQRLPLKMRHAAWRAVLSHKATTGSIIVVNELSQLDGKTKTWVKLSRNLPVSPSKRLIVDARRSETASRSIHNLPTDHYAALNQISLYDLMRFPTVIFVKPALDDIVKRLAKIKTEVKS